MSEDHAKYNVGCLEQLRRELAAQIKKYPRQMAWIEIELARAKIIAEKQQAKGCLIAIQAAEQAAERQRATDAEIAENYNDDPCAGEQPMSNINPKTKEGG